MQRQCLAMTLATPEDTDHTNNVHVMFNMYWDGIEFEIPKVDGLQWYQAIDTSLPFPTTSAHVNRLLFTTAVMS